MENRTTFYLIDEYTGELICKGVNYMDVIKPALNLAYEQNYGLIRYWIDKKLYIDAGPRMFYIIADGDVNANDLLELLGGKEQC